MVEHPDIIFMSKTEVQFFTYSTLGSLIKFKHIVAFTNKAQTVLYFFQEQLKWMQL